ncbi:MAG: DUF6093 family protein [Motilibacteraceae bacterium]
MSVESATLQGRAAAEALMLDTCTITRAGTGKGPWNDGTGQYDHPARVTVYQGKCKVQTRDVQVNNPDVAGREAFVVDWTVHLPVVGSEGVQQGDTVTITAAALDSALVGRTFTIDGPHLGTAKTARRLPVKAEV